MNKKLIKIANRFEEDASSEEPPFPEEEQDDPFYGNWVEFYVSPRVGEIIQIAIKQFMRANHEKLTLNDISMLDNVLLSFPRVY